MSSPDTTDDYYERYWSTYLLHCRAENMQPSFSDFQVWVDENVPEVGYAY